MEAWVYFSKVSEWEIRILEVVYKKLFLKYYLSYKDKRISFPQIYLQFILIHIFLSFYWKKFSLITRTINISNFLESSVWNMRAF